MDDMSSYGVRR